MFFEEWSKTPASASWGQNLVVTVRADGEKAGIQAGLLLAYKAPCLAAE